MNKIIYLVRHSGPFVNIEYQSKVSFSQISKNMILTTEAEEKAKRMCNLDELNNIEEIYSSNSYRSIATIKYLAEKKNMSIKVIDDFNEREFGITYVEELPKDFVINQFKDDNYKLDGGESMKDVMQRIDNKFNNILKSPSSVVILSLHAIVLCCFIKKYCDVSFDGKTFKIIKNGKVIYNKLLGNPDLFKLTIDENGELINLENIVF